MRPSRHWLSLAITLATLTLPRPSAAQVLDPIQYSLFKAADFGYGCDGPCACPFVFSGSLDGSFTFYRTSVDPLYTHYELLNILWHYTAPGTGKIATITGHGTYDIGGEVANMQRMQLDVVTDGVLAQHFDSGLVPARGIFPAIDVDVRLAVNACIDSVLHVVAGPQGTASVPPSGPTMRLSTTPNPTRGAADVALSLPAAATGEVEVLNVAGQRVAELASGTFAAGDNRWHWDGRTLNGTDAGFGVFWVRARLGTNTVTQGFVRFR